MLLPNYYLDSSWSTILATDSIVGLRTLNLRICFSLEDLKHTSYGPDPKRTVEKGGLAKMLKLVSPTLSNLTFVARMPKDPEMVGHHDYLSRNACLVFDYLLGQSRFPKLRVLDLRGWAFNGGEPASWLVAHAATLRHVHLIESETISSYGSFATELERAKDKLDLDGIEIFNTKFNHEDDTIHARLMHSYRSSEHYNHDEDNTSWGATVNSELEHLTLNGRKNFIKRRALPVFPASKDQST